jgi:predicted exporter
MIAIGRVPSALERILPSLSNAALAITICLAFARSSRRAMISSVPMVIPSTMMAPHMTEMAILVSELLSFGTVDQVPPDVPTVSR